MTRTEIINRLAQIYGARTYLEIGIDHPSKNFNRIICATKIGVDPAVRAPGIYKITSDQFFARNKMKFDLIFIDGLHHCDQVTRDIDNALNALAPNGTVVVHDCNPTTKEMQEVPRAQGIWTGDVWRAWLKFRTRNDLSMAVFDTDYGVGVIRRGHQQPICIDTNPTYEQFNEHKKEWLNLVPIEPSPVSICIPAFEQYGHGTRTLTDLLSSIKTQRGAFEVVVSDNANDDSIRKVCDAFRDYFALKYIHNPNRGVSTNTNNAIEHASHEFIKPMYQDDKLIYNTAISDISMALMFDRWVAISGFSIDQNGRQGKQRDPVYNEPQVMAGKNTIGMPSVIAFHKNEIRFDEKLKTMLDCEFYFQLHKKFGPPGYVKRRHIGSRYWNGSTSRQQPNYISQEVPYLKEKHGL